MPSPFDDNNLAAAMARYDAANGFTEDPKVTPLRKRGRPAKAAGARPAPGKKLTPEQSRDQTLALFNLPPLKKAENLPPYDVTDVTRYKAVPEWAPHKNPNVTRIWRRYSYVMKDHGISPTTLKMWREHTLFMSVEQLAQMVRVNERTIRNWESGKSEIPFAMWWVMHSTLQDPEYFLDRPGFHDFYIEYDHQAGESVLCSHTWPDIRCTPGNLYVQRTALNRAMQLEQQLAAKQREVDELTAENTRLRQMLKAGTVAEELAAMHQHIGNLLAKMHTADVVDFPLAAAAG